MAASKLVFSFELDALREMSVIMDDVMSHHQVGGMYITQSEHDTLTRVAERDLSELDLPCRFIAIAGYLTEGGSRTWDGDEQHVLCRASLGWDSRKMILTRIQVLTRAWETGESRFVVFAKYLLENTEIQTEHYILNHCFIVPSCKDHESCKRFNILNTDVGVRFSCCDTPLCDEFCNQDKAIAILNPGRTHISIKSKAVI